MCVNTYDTDRNPEDGCLNRIKTRVEFCDKPPTGVIVHSKLPGINYCDKECNICACSTPRYETNFVNPSHCSDHGHCEADICQDDKCYGAKCICDPGRGGSKCEIGNYFQFLACTKIFNFPLM